MKKPQSLPTHVFDQNNASVDPFDDLEAVQNVIVDCNDGCVTYSIQSIRGLFGLGNKAIAIPSSALELKPYGTDLLNAIMSSRRTEDEIPLPTYENEVRETRVHNTGKKRNTIH